MITRLLKALTADIVNPSHDKRRKHGMEKTAVFTKGTRFVATFYPKDHKDPDFRMRAELDQPGWIQIVGGSHIGSFELVRQFMANCEPVEAETFADITAIWDYGFSGEEVINRLLKVKVLTKDAVILAVQTMDAEEQAKQQ